ncbi:MAG TPA: NCS2 family permease [Thermomicrobiales bacterium]|jgi:AGZA family xanthine/uracil permease-like MFS transporter|nr:NCS2 family permease [Thermomicrobiales bacterium]
MAYPRPPAAATGDQSPSGQAPAGPDASPLERLFRLTQHGTNIRTELIAGLSTFLVMAYIIAVNPAILSLDGGGLDVRQVATVTCLVAGVMTIFMGLYANMAIAIAPGLGINAIVAFTLVGSLGLSFPEAMGVVVTQGIIITVLVLAGVRRYVLDLVPFVLKQAIAVGIGFFILFIGLRDAGIAIISPAGLPELAPLNTWPIFVAIVGLLVTIVLMARGVRAGILIGIVVATIVAFIVPGDAATFPDEPFAGPDFGLLGEFSFSYWGTLGALTAVLVVFSLLLADFFDTMGTLIGVGNRAGYVDDQGRLRNAQRPLLVDSLAAVAGGASSSSSATTYIESLAGVEAGGRTGLTSVVTGALFLLALPFVAMVSAVPSVATAPALIIIGVLMASALTEPEPGTGKRLDLSNLEVGLPVVLTFLTMPLTFNITNGIGVGFVSYVLIKLVRGKAREVPIGLYIVAAAFLVYFLRWSLFDAQF